MNRILTWAELRDQIKTEAGTQEDSTQLNDLLLGIANDLLSQAVSVNKDAREFALDQTFDILNPTNLSITTVAIGHISQVYYVRPIFGSTFRYDLTEQNGIVGPPGIRGKPNAYTIKQTVNTVLLPGYLITFYPTDSATIGDKIQIVGSGVPFIQADANLLQYPTMYSWLKLGILQRYRLSRNDESDKVQLMEPLINRAGAAGSEGGKDRGNNESQPQN